MLPDGALHRIGLVDDWDDLVRVADPLELLRATWASRVLATRNALFVKRAVLLLAAGGSIHCDPA